MKYSKISELIYQARKGKMFILVDDENRENEGDLVIPASNTSQKKINLEFGKVLSQSLIYLEKIINKYNLTKKFIYDEVYLVIQIFFLLEF